MREALRQAAADADFRPAGSRPLARDDFDIVAHDPCLIADAPCDDVRDLRRIEHFGEGNQDVHLGRHERAAIRACCDVRIGRYDTRDVAAQATRQLGIRALAQHNDVLTRTGLGKRCAEAVCQREHTDEHRDDQADTEGGERRGEGPLYHAADVVDDRDHSTCRSACTTGSRAARSAGIRPSATSPPMMSVVVVTLNPGRKPAPLKLMAGYSSLAPPRPSAAPVKAITPASTMVSANNNRSEKPIVFKTAISGVRSRALIIMALAVTSRIANTTARPIVLIRKLTFPHIVAKLA